MKSVTLKKIKFSIEDFFSKCDQIRSILLIWVTFTGEILNGKLHFLGNVYKTQRRSSPLVLTCMLLGYRFPNVR